MTKELIVYRPTATEALQHLDEFTQKMNQFMEAHTDYKTETSLSKVENGWKVTVTIKKDEK